VGLNDSGPCQAPGTMMISGLEGMKFFVVPIVV